MKHDYDNWCSVLTRPGCIWGKEEQTNSEGSAYHLHRAIFRVVQELVAA